MQEQILSIPEIIDNQQLNEFDKNGPSAIRHYWIF
jgi:hypothetical protein